MHRGILYFVQYFLPNKGQRMLDLDYDAELDLLCLETLSVTLALSSEMLSLTSLTYDSSSEPCEGEQVQSGVSQCHTKENDTIADSLRQRCRLIHMEAYCRLPVANKLQSPAIYSAAVITRRDTAAILQLETYIWQTQWGHWMLPKGSML